MIKSITFNGLSGYIIDKIPEPYCPVRGYEWRKKELTDEEKDLIKEYNKEHRKWARHKDDYNNPELVRNLLNRKIDFKPGKINLIFGPNGSGKTTIMKALAGNAGTKDGYTSLVSPSEMCGFFDDPTPELFRKYLDTRLMKNSAEIDWDGAPIYYDNFANRKNYGSIGDLSGSVLGDDIGTELSYIMMNEHISRGQNSIYLMSRLFGIAKSETCFAEMFSDYVNPDGSYKDLNMNDVWEKNYKIQLDYYMGFEKSKIKSPGTFLFDEIDKSLDIENICLLYTDILPALVRKTGIQIIVISHSPIVLSDKIMNNDLYNFISLDEEYSEKCLKNINKLFK